MLVLASASPRRREILSRFIRNFRVVPSNAEERCSSGVPKECAVELARKKAREVYSRVGGTVIGADTVVSVEGRILGKPRDEEQAYEMLKTLSGRVHRVTTGYCIIHGGGEMTGAVTTEVKFRELDDEIIWAYIRTGSRWTRPGPTAYRERRVSSSSGLKATPTTSSASRWR